MYINLKIKVSHLIIGVVLLGSLLWAGLAIAGDPDSNSDPASTSSYSLEDLYQRLAAGTVGSTSVFTEPTNSPGTGTMHTINEIMAKAPALDNTNGATVTQVISGTIFWGLTSGQWGLQTGTLTIADASTYNAAVPKTGQTTSHVTSDDGDLEMGVVWPTPRFITSTTGIVTDTLTGLIWLENANCFDTSTWTQAFTDTATLNSGECGLSDGSIEGDWRLPNMRELQSLLHYGVYNPAVPNTTGTEKWSEGDPFTNVALNNYRASSTRADFTSNTWIVDMGNGYVSSAPKTDSFYVWPVRGGQ